MKKKIFGWVLLSIVFCLSTYAGTVHAAEKNLREIIFWDQEGPNQEPVLDELISVFEKSHSDIHIKRIHLETQDLREKFVANAEGKDAPDVVLGPNDYLWSFVPGHFISPAAEIMGSSFFGDFDKQALSCASFNGAIYMVPDRLGNELCLVYNKRLVEKAPKTWDEMVRIGEKLKKDGNVQYIVAFHQQEPFFTLPFLGAFGGKVFDKPASADAKPTLNTPEMKAWCQWLVKIHNEKQIPEEADYDTASNLFTESKTAFLINGPWSFVNYRESYSMDIGIAAIPMINGGWPASYIAVKGYTFTRSAMKSPERKKAAKIFVEWMTGEEAQLHMIGSHFQLPSRKSLYRNKAVTDEPIISGQLDAVRHGTALPILHQMYSIWDAVKPVQLDLFAGKVRPEDAPAIMQKKAEEGITKIQGEK